MTHWRTLAWLYVWGFMLVAVGCSAHAASDLLVEADDPLLADASVDDSGAWQSAPWARSTWIPYGAGGSVTIEHGLRRLPTSVEVYLSVDGDDRETRDPRPVFGASGNIATLSEITDESVSLNNNTRGDFYVRLVLR